MTNLVEWAVFQNPDNINANALHPNRTHFRNDAISITEVSFGINGEKKT